VAAATAIPKNRTKDRWRDEQTGVIGFQREKIFLGQHHTKGRNENPGLRLVRQDLTDERSLRSFQTTRSDDAARLFPIFIAL
jgi:hypothetical protein